MADDKRTLLQRRRGLCLDIAEQIESMFFLHGMSPPYDTDAAARLIDSMLPDTLAEALERQAELEKAELAAELKAASRPGPIRRLRTLLGLDGNLDVSAFGVVEAAIQRIERLENELEERRGPASESKDAGSRNLLVDVRSCGGGIENHGEFRWNAVDSGHRWLYVASSGSGYWECEGCGLPVTGGPHDGGPYYPGRGGKVERCSKQLGGAP